MVDESADRLYVYGVLETAETGGLKMTEAGLKDCPVEVLSWQGLAALVSDLGTERVRSSRADLRTHERVVEEAARQVTLLPLQFGVVMPGPAAVTGEFLEPNEQFFGDLLTELRQTEEYRLKASYLPGVALTEIVQRDAAVRRARGRSRAAEAGYAEQIYLGELVAVALERLRERDAASLLRRLEPSAKAVRDLAADGEDTAARLAILVDKQDRERFDRTLAELAEETSQRLSFELVGPLAPWDFVDEPESVSGAMGIRISGRS